MTNKATMDMMDKLHMLTAQQLADIIENGTPVFSKETGEEVGREPAPASYIAAAIKFLKDNDISAEPNSNRFDHLQDALKDLPTMDDGEEHYPYN